MWIRPKAPRSFPLSSLVVWVVSLLYFFWICNILILLFSHERGWKRLHLTSRTRQAAPFATHSTRPLPTTVNAGGRGRFGGPPHTSSTLTFSRSDYRTNPKLNGLPFSLTPVINQIDQEIELSQIELWWVMWNGVYTKSNEKMFRFAQWT